MTAQAVCEIDRPNAAPVEVRASGWLRGPAFDSTLIVGVLAIALVLGGVALVRPALLPLVLAVDLWLLAYPHVASTYTRIAFDKPAIREHRVLLFVAPPIVLAATAGTAWLGGGIALNTLYFNWQAWHYTRQSYGIARAYERSAGGAADVVGSIVVFAFPLWGVLHRAHQAPSTFYGSPLYSPPVPHAVVIASAIVALASLAVWTLLRARAVARSETRSIGHDAFIVSHVAITVISYIAVTDVTRGWLFINVWHNAQYLLFVWAQNARRFRGGVDPARPLISRMSQPEQVATYIAVCLGVSTVFYLVLGQATARIAWQALPIFLVCHQAVNFQHYVVDAVIWRAKTRSKPR